MKLRSWRFGYDECCRRRRYRVGPTLFLRNCSSTGGTPSRFQNRKYIFSRIWRICKWPCFSWQVETNYYRFVGFMTRSFLIWRKMSSGICRPTWTWCNVSDFQLFQVLKVSTDSRNPVWMGVFWSLSVWEILAGTCGIRMLSSRGESQSSSGWYEIESQKERFSNSLSNNFSVAFVSSKLF